VKTCPDAFVNEQTPQIQSCFDFIKREFRVRLSFNAVSLSSKFTHRSMVTVLCRLASSRRTCSNSIAHPPASPNSPASSAWEPSPTPETRVP
jgi:hypothetical protein